MQKIGKIVSFGETIYYKATRITKKFSKDAAFNSGYLFSFCAFFGCFVFGVFPIRDFHSRRNDTCFLLNVNAVLSNTRSVPNDRKDTNFDEVKYFRTLHWVDLLVFGFPWFEFVDLFLQSGGCWLNYGLRANWSCYRESDASDRNVFLVYGWVLDDCFV